MVCFLVNFLLVVGKLKFCYNNRFVSQRHLSYQLSSTQTINRGALIVEIFFPRIIDGLYPVSFLVIYNVWKLYRIIPKLEVVALG